MREKTRAGLICDMDFFHVSARNRPSDVAVNG